jgi:hypothetical protein
MDLWAMGNVGLRYRGIVGTGDLYNYEGMQRDKWVIGGY